MRLSQEAATTATVAAAAAATEKTPFTLSKSEAQF